MLFFIYLSSFIHYFPKPLFIISSALVKISYFSLPNLMQCPFSPARLRFPHYFALTITPCYHHRPSSLIMSILNLYLFMLRYNFITLMKATIIRNLLMVTIIIDLFGDEVSAKNYNLFAVDTI